MPFFIKLFLLCLLVNGAYANLQDSDIIKCLSQTPHCSNLPSLISWFMDNFFLWNQYINTEGKFIDRISSMLPEFPKPIISEIYKYVEKDLLKEFKRMSFYYALDYIKDYQEYFDKYKVHRIYIVKKYENDPDVISSVFEYPSEKRIKFSISKNDKEIISEQNMLLNQVTGEKAKETLILISGKKDPQKMNYNILELVDLLHIEENEQIENLDDFRKIIDKKCILTSIEIQNLHPYTKNTIYKQRKSVKQFVTFLEMYNNLNYMQAWIMIENFFDAFSTKIFQKFELKEISLIFYNKFTSGEHNKLHTLARLFHEYAINYKRIKMKNKLVDYLKSNQRDKNKYLPMIYQTLILYEIDWKNTDYTDLMKAFEVKDLIVKEEDVIIIYKYYFEIIDLHKRQNALEEIYRTVKSNLFKNIFEIYSCIEDVINLYSLNNEEISFDILNDKVKKVDYIVNDLQINTVYPFINKYNLLKERMEARKDLIFGFKEYIYSTCFFTFKYFEKFNKLYQIEKLKNFDYDTIKNYFVKIDEYMISSIEIEYIYRYLLKCSDYQNRYHISKILYDYTDTKDQISSVLSIYSEIYIEVYKLNNLDIKNFDSFYSEVKSFDDILPTPMLYKIYPVVLNRKKYNIRKNIRNKIMLTFKNGESKLMKIMEFLEKLIIEYNINIENLKVKDLKNRISLLDGQAIFKEVFVIFKSLMKYIDYLERKGHLNKLLLYLKEENKLSLYKANFYVNQLIYKYKFENIDIKSKSNFINQIMKFDENIDLLDSGLLHQQVLKHLESHQRSIVFDLMTNIIDLNKGKEFVHLSSNIKNFVKLYKLNLNDVKSFYKFMKKIYTFEIMCSESRFKNLYPFVMKHFSHLKKVKNLNPLINGKLNAASSISLKFKPNIKFMEKHYNLDFENLINFISFLNAVKQTDKYPVESILILIYPHLKYYFISLKTKNNIKETTLIKNIMQYLEEQNLIDQYEKSTYIFNHKIKYSINVNKMFDNLHISNFKKYKKNDEIIENFNDMKKYI